jgi:hypothetical protein
MLERYGDEAIKESTAGAEQATAGSPKLMVFASMARRA